MVGWGKDGWLKPFGALGLLLEAKKTAQWTYGSLHPGRLTPGTYSHHPFRKENGLNQTSMIMFHVNLQGCNYGEKTGINLQISWFKVRGFLPKLGVSPKAWHLDQVTNDTWWGRAFHFSWFHHLLNISWAVFVAEIFNKHWKRQNCSPLKISSII